MPVLFPPVEPRSIVGTGTTQDPENIEALQNEWAERERANRKPPKKKFKQVLREKAENLTLNPSPPGGEGN